MLRRRAILGTGTDAAYVEVDNGRPISFPTVTARYLRLYSNGTTYHSLNEYIEVEAWGLPAP